MQVRIEESAPCRVRIDTAARWWAVECNTPEEARAYASGLVDGAKALHGEASLPFARGWKMTTEEEG
jgi:hypothetical protein